MESDEKINVLLDDTSKKNSIKVKKLQTINENSKEEIVSMIDNILKRINLLSQEKDFFEVYNDNLSKILNLNECLKITKDIKNKNSYITKDSGKAMLPKTNKATKIINKDDFSLPSPLVQNSERLDKNIMPKYSKTQKLDELKINDDEFD